MGHNLGFSILLVGERCLKKHLHEIHGLVECNDSNHSSPKQLVKLLKVKGCLRVGNRIVERFSLLKKLKEIDMTLGELLFGSD